MRRREDACGMTLIELIVVMAIIGVLAVVSAPMITHGVKTLVFLPKALLVNHTATEVMHQMIEGGPSSAGTQVQPIRGLRDAARYGTEPAIWCASPGLMLFRTSDHRCVMLSLSAQAQLTRAIWSGPAMQPWTHSCGSPTGIASTETIPPEPPGSVQISAPTALFRYYNQTGAPLALSGCGALLAANVRRVEIEFVAQTGNGNFDQGEAREQVLSSVAIRVP